MQASRWRERQILGSKANAHLIDHPVAGSTTDPLASVNETLRPQNGDLRGKTFSRWRGKDTLACISWCLNIVKYMQVPTYGGSVRYQKLISAEQSKPARRWRVGERAQQ